jgi:choline dehydrogenase-like flavoprotein
LRAARLLPGTEGPVLETDVVVVGSGAGGSFIAAEIASMTDQRVLILERGDFVRPTEFAQRESLMMPRIFHTEFSTLAVPGTNMEVPTVSTAVVSGKLVGGSATINHGLAFEPPKPVVRDWHDRLGADLQYSDLQPHLDAIRAQLRIAAVPEAQISGSNWRLREGARALGLPHHGPSERNAHQCIGCGFCDLGCRYNRKLTPLNMVLPKAARGGAQLIANCHVDELILESLPGDGVLGRTHRVTGLKATLTDRRGVPSETIEVRAKRVILAAGPFASPRILMRSKLPRIRRRKGSQPAIGERFSTHGTITFYGDFDEPIYPSNAGPPMAYFVKKYDVEDQHAADPDQHHVKYALEGMLNHPIAHAQLMPYESAESFQAFMRRYNQTMTLAVMYRDKPVGRVTPKAFEYALAEEDHAGWLDSIQTGARIMFASGAKRVFFNAHRPIILNGPEEIDHRLTLDLMRKRLIQITSGHPMGGNALGGDPKRDVVDSRGRSWDVTGLYVADSSILPTSLGVNPCFTTYALGRWIAHNIVDEIRA